MHHYAYRISPKTSLGKVNLKLGMINKKKIQMKNRAPRILQKIKGRIQTIKLIGGEHADEKGPVIDTAASISVWGHKDKKYLKNLR